VPCTRTRQSLHPTAIWCLHSSAGEFGYCSNLVFAELSSWVWIL
jgi:hypothetical protein